MYTKKKTHTQKCISLSILPFLINIIFSYQGYLKEVVFPCKNKIPVDMHKTTNDIFEVLTHTKENVSITAQYVKPYK